jgi:ABC-type antimicrobial peptide transport system permease subunit
VLRSLGFTRRMTYGVVSSQSTTVGLVGLVIGIPLGLAVGRLAWTWVADEVPLVYVSPVALVAVGLVIPIALVVANLIAALPGRRASRLAPATVLRTE